MKRLKIIFIILFIPLLVLSSYNLSAAYSTNKILYYDGKNKEFKYYNTSNHVLFDNFKELMPGDKKEDSITISAKNISKDSRLYMEIKNNEILDYVNIKVYSNDMAVFDSAKESEKRILLYTFNKDDDITLKFVIQIDKEVGNEIDEAKFDFDLNFIMEDSEGVIIPATFDNSHIFLNIGAFIVSLLMISILILKKEKEIIK